MLETSISIAKSDDLNSSAFYMGINYYDYTERTTAKDPFMTLETAIPTIIIGSRDEAAIRGEDDTNKFSYYTEFSIGK